MKKSYYTSLCKAWLDHEVLSKPGEKEKIIEMVANKNDLSERFCEETIERLLAEKEKKQITIQLLDHLADIDFIRLSNILCEEYTIP